MNDSDVLRTFSRAIVLAATGCGAMVTPGTGGDGGIRDAANDHSVVDANARTCTRNTDCAGNEMCDGPPGCDTPWTCVPARDCDETAAEFCACDGQTTFFAAPGCVGQPYLHRGVCESPPPVDAGTNTCEAVPSDEVIAPDAVYCGDSIPVTVHQTNVGGCGCSVNVIPRPDGTPTSNLSVCDCCDVCDCADGVGEASVVLTPPPCGIVPAAQNVDVAGHTVVIVPQRATQPATWLPTVTGVEVRAPRSTSGPTLRWLRLRGTMQRCASEGTLICARNNVTETSSGTRIEVSVDDCSQTDCDGPTHPVAFDTWHSLGADLRPGSYRVVVSGQPDTLFEVSGTR